MNNIHGKYIHVDVLKVSTRKLIILDILGCKGAMINSFTHFAMKDCREGTH